MIRWTTLWWCVACHGRLTDHERSYNHGRCPRCGHKGAKAGTFVETYETAEPVRRHAVVLWLLDRLSPVTAAAFMVGMVVAFVLVKLGIVSS